MSLFFVYFIFIILYKYRSHFFILQIFSDFFLIFFVVFGSGFQEMDSGNKRLDFLIRQTNLPARIPAVTIVMQYNDSERSERVT